MTNGSRMVDDAARQFPAIVALNHLQFRFSHISRNRQQIIRRKMYNFPPNNRAPSTASDHFTFRASSRLSNLNGPSTVREWFSKITLMRFRRWLRNSNFLFKIFLLELEIRCCFSREASSHDGRGRSHLTPIFSDERETARRKSWISLASSYRFENVFMGRRERWTNAGWGSSLLGARTAKCGAMNRETPFALRFTWSRWCVCGSI